jgi:isopenicillin N synthase-like dioxygenase
VQLPSDIVTIVTKLRGKAEAFFDLPESHKSTVVPVAKHGNGNGFPTDIGWIPITGVKESVQYRYGHVGAAVTWNGAQPTRGDKARAPELATYQDIGKKLEKHSTRSFKAIDRWCRELFERLIAATPLTSATTSTAKRETVSASSTTATPSSSSSSSTTTTAMTLPQLHGRLTDASDVSLATLDSSKWPSSSLLKMIRYQNQSTVPLESEHEDSGLFTLCLLPERGLQVWNTGEKQWHNCSLDNPFNAVLLIGKVSPSPKLPSSQISALFFIIDCWWMI